MSTKILSNGLFFFTFASVIKVPDEEEPIGQAHSGGMLCERRMEKEKKKKRYKSEERVCTRPMFHRIHRRREDKLHRAKGSESSIQLNCKWAFRGVRGIKLGFIVAANGNERISMCSLFSMKCDYASAIESSDVCLRDEWSLCTIATERERERKVLSMALIGYTQYFTVMYLLTAPTTICTHTYTEREKKIETTVRPHSSGTSVHFHCSVISLASLQITRDTRLNNWM